MLLKGIYQPLSYLFGQNSEIAPIVSAILTMGLNAILAVVCVGYISGFLQMLLPMPMMLSTGIAVFFLICALPFELLDTKTQNDRATVKPPEWVFANKAMPLFAISSTIMGSMQYLIRNYNLVFNFAKTMIGGYMIKGIGLAFATQITILQFAAIGGIVGFLAHFLVAFGNWDKLVNLKRARHMGYAYGASIIWGVLLGVLSCFLMMALVNMPLLLVLSAVTAGLMVSQLPFHKLGKVWESSIIYTLPLGAALYTLVDACNSIAVVNNLGWMSPLTMGLCLAFGAFSWVNTSLIWGYNTTYYLHSDKHVDKTHLKFVKLYYSDPSVRRVTSYAKEALLCGLDLLNNRLALAMVNSVMMSTLGVSVSLAMLNLCTVFFAFNRLAILYFQSGENTQQIISSKVAKQLGETNSAKFCKMLLGQNAKNKRVGNGSIYQRSQRIRASRA